MSDKADIEVKKESSQCGSSTSDSETRSNRRLLGKRKVIAFKSLTRANAILFSEVDFFSDIFLGKSKCKR